jgi:hypothetical protein
VARSRPGRYAGRTADDAVDAVAAAAATVRDAVGAADATVRVILDDGGGRLSVACELGPERTASRRRSARRRAVFESGRSVQIDRAASSGETLRIVPLGGERRIGVIEVVAPGDRLALRSTIVDGAIETCGQLVRTALERVRA